MDDQKKPRSRVKKVVNDGKGVEIHGEGLGTGPVNNMGNYSDRKEQEVRQTAKQPQGRPQVQNPFGQQNRPQGQSPFGQQSRPQQGQSPFGQQSRPQQGQSPFGQQSRPQQVHNPFSQQNWKQGQDPFVQNRPASSAGGGEQRQYHSAVKQNGTQNGQRATGSGGGSSKILLIIIALVVLLGGGKLSGLFGGGEQELLNNLTQQQTGTGTGTGTSTGTQTQTGSGLDITNLLSSFLGSSGTSAYDFSGSAGSLLSGLGGSQTGNQTIADQIFTSSSSSGSNTAQLDENVSKKARDKYTVIRGNNRDTVTILVYMCGTDLESQQGMATSDLKEMANATYGKNVNLIVYTGGCSRWRNNVISSRVNQIYRISDGKFECLEENAGSSSMVDPNTLASFIEYGKKNYSADRMCLIFWDHGGGSVSGYGYDEKVGHNQSMTLAGINTALKKADIKFDFIGFDACLMATVENGLMLGQYADYMIASEETEPGVGWYYTNWLTKLGKNTSMPTIEIGKLIADDFVEVCNRQCRGQATTLSVVDLAELQATVPKELKEFSIDTNELIQKKEYKSVSKARSKTREFAQQSRIDQIDLVDFARNLGTSEGKDLAKALQGAVKYNRTGGNISNAYGLSIYFPYKRSNKVNQMVSTYKAIGMDEEYTRCIQEFASLEVSGQVSAGTPISSFGMSQNASAGLLNSLMGQSGYSSTQYSNGGLEELLSGMYGSSGGTGSILDLFMGRSLTADQAAEYIAENHFDASQLVWNDGKMNLTKENWSNVESLVKNVFVDNGSGYIDLGCDAEYEVDGDTLIDNFDGTWLSIDGYTMAYYYLNTIEYGNDQFVIYGYAPALLNDVKVDLIIYFINGEDGYISGALYKYDDPESDTQAKEMISIGEGDRIQFICDYYDYDGNYHDSYKLGECFTLKSTYDIHNAPINRNCKVTYCFTDYYQQKYWTPAIQWAE